MEFLYILCTLYVYILENLRLAVFESTSKWLLAFTVVRYVCDTRFIYISDFRHVSLMYMVM